MFSLYRVSNVRIGSLHPPLSPRRASVCVCQTGKKMFSLYKVFKRQNWLPPSPLSPQRASVYVCVPHPPPSRNQEFLSGSILLFFSSGSKELILFVNLKSQIFISPFLGMSYRMCHQSQQDGHHYNDLLCRTENLRNDFSRKCSIWN